MPDLDLTRSLPAPPEAVWPVIATADQVVRWWGPQGFSIADGSELSFGRKGPWVSTMISPEGNRFKVSGHVTHVKDGESVGFTWAWHDENDARGPESHVTISIADDGAGGTTLTLAHRELEDAESAASHEMGWQSTFNDLEALFKT